jgi:hypothetical protein
MTQNWLKISNTKLKKKQLNIRKFKINLLYQHTRAITCTKAKKLSPGSRPIVSAATKVT